MKQSTASAWTLDDLSARVALALAEDYDGQPSGRVRDVPDPRTIRYYTTLGLLDRPTEMRGRTALYGRRHLLQLVAIKRLQTRGLSLSEIQERLLGLPNSRLESLAELPKNAEAGDPEFTPPKEETPDRSTSFWTAAPTIAENGEAVPSADRPVAPRALQVSHAGARHHRGSLQHAAAPGAQYLFLESDSRSIQSSVLTAIRRAGII